ncbi:Hypothetical protein, putative [Bodo saltans]|uniref:Glycosyltransferase 61 catalytic domain-containing protein n=1 Tax=Bodo saltans TaxID=75058 RepID=A0A0S4JLN3_BODSA|nr:Hypothetical protein, putative [Bodo saltans]|eukprot:CUG90833.1 Hypothetical protein, putative [Bodo saltans]
MDNISHSNRNTSTLHAPYGAAQLLDDPQPRGVAEESSHDDSLSSVVAASLSDSTSSAPAKPSSGRYAARIVNHSHEFYAACVDYDTTHRLRKWSLGAGNRMPYTGVNANGDELLCMRGRQLFHLNNSAEYRWVQVSSGNHKNPHLPPLTIRPLSQDALLSAEKAGRVRYHAHTAVVATALLSMYHLLNDFLVPLHATLRLLFRNATFAPPIQQGSLEVVLMYLDGQSRGYSSDAATIAFANSMVPADGGSLRLLIHPQKADAETTLHCYCRGLLMPGVALVSMGPSTRLIEGDTLRRAGTKHIKEKLNAQFGFAAYGTMDPPSSQWRDYGLWNTTTTTATSSEHAAPRLLFLLRNKTRIIGNPDEIARIASAVGFDVEVMTPEHETVERQARAARYAHVVMAIHGQALTWMMMMDSVVATHCRQVVELRHYGRKLRRVHNVYELVAADNYVMYRTVGAVDAVFDPKYVSSQTAEKALLMRKPFPHRYRGFSWQTAFYSAHEVRHVLRKAFDHARTCEQLRGKKYTLTAHDIGKSDLAWGR